ncbi:hypothetical protein [Acetobacter nitrogenifigens]|nr:hypothetical protein [Acetobacter nitrogenifigens]
MLSGRGLHARQTLRLPGYGATLPKQQSCGAAAGEAAFFFA